MSDLNARCISVPLMLLVYDGCAGWSTQLLGLLYSMVRASNLRLLAASHDHYLQRVTTFRKSGAGRVVAWALHRLSCQLGITAHRRDSGHTAEGQTSAQPSRTPCAMHRR